MDYFLVTFYDNCGQTPAVNITIPIHSTGHKTEYVSHWLLILV